MPIADSLLESYSGQLFKGHLLPVTCICVNWEGTLCVTGSKDCCLIACKIYLGDLQSGKKLKVLKGSRDQEYPGHSQDVLAVAISDDSKYLVSAGKDRLIIVWDGKTYEKLNVLKGHRDMITGLAFGKNTHTLFSGSFDRHVKVWNIEQMAYMDSLFGHTSSILSLDSYLGERAITSGLDCSVRVWKFAEESQLVFNGHTGSIECVRVINNTYFVTGSQDGSVALWRLNKKKPIYILPNAHGGSWITSLAVLRSSDLVASGSHDGFINLYKFGGERLQLKVRIEAPGYINGMEFTRSGEYLVAAVGRDYRIGRWNSSFKTPPGLFRVRLDLHFRSGELELLRWQD